MGQFEPRFQEEGVVHCQYIDTTRKAIDCATTTLPLVYRVCIAMAAVVFKLCALHGRTFQRKNVISVSNDVMRRNTDTKISKLKHQHPDGAHCTLQTSSLHGRSSSGAGVAKPP